MPRPRHSPHLVAAVLATATTAVVAPTAAGAPRLIAPLDVRVSANVRPGTVLQGSWNAYSTPEGGRWIGENLKLTETWTRGVPKAVRVRGRTSGGPTTTHYVEVNYLKRRVGEGVLTEERPAGDTSPPLELHCLAQGADEPGGSITTGETTSMQVVDQPGRGRVVVRGPGIAFLGPQCRRPGYELPVRGVGIHPPVVATPWVPEGALTAWRLTVPRAEFAAGGTFRFRGRYSYGYPIQMYTTSDVFGSAITHGKVAVDLSVRRVGR